MRNPTCKACPLHATAQNVCIEEEDTTVPFGVDVLLVGQAPGSEEDIAGRPFVGPSGTLIRRLVGDVDFGGVARYTNAVRCMPPADRAPTLTELKACRQYLLSEVQAYAPKVIVALGNTALVSLTGRSGITEKRGQTTVLHKDFNLAGEIVVPTFHPAHALRAREEGGQRAADIEETIKGDLYRAKHVLEGTSDEEIGYVVFDHARVGVRPTTVPPVVALDIETRSDRRSITLCGISRPDGRVAVVRDGAMPGVLRGMQCATTVVGHNASGFDAPIIERAYGVKLDVDDTMLAAYAVNENEPSYSLEALAVKYCGAKPWKEITWDWDAIKDEELPQVYAYNARDVTYTKRLWDFYAPQLQEKGVYPLYKHVLVPFARVLYNIEQRGFYIDEAQVLRTEAELQKTLKASNETLASVFGLENPRSPQQVSALLFGELGFQPMRYSRQTGAASTDELTLKTLGINPKSDTQRMVIDELLRNRENETLRKFVAKFKLLLSTHQDHRAHPSYSQIHTATGRSNSFKGEDGIRFNAQNIPRDARFRAVLAAAPGKKLVIGDLSQIELRIIAFLSRCPVMMEAFRRGDDPHRLMAATITGKHPDDVTDDERFYAKRTNFGFGYGAQAKTFIETSFKDYGIRFTMAQATRFRNAYFERWAGIGPWHERLYDELEATGCIRSPLRTYHIAEGNFEYLRPSAKVEAWRMATNYPVQGTAHYLAACAVILIEQQVGGIVHFGHDSVILEVDEGKEEAAAEVVRDCMERQAGVYLAERCGVEIDVPIAASVKIGEHWT